MSLTASLSGATLLTTKKTKYAEKVPSTLVVIGDGDGSGITLGNDPNHKGTCAVIYTVPDDQAALSGLREGDTVLSLNGFPAQSHEHAVEVRAAAEWRLPPSASICLM